MGISTTWWEAVINNYDAIIKNQRKIERDIVQEMMLYVYEDVNEIFEQGVSDFYQAYDPIFYHRTGALYDAFKITKTWNTVSWRLSGELMPNVHRVDNSYIYEFVFNQGYHGGAVGANAYGQPMWRTPHPSQGSPAWHSWGRPAVCTESPSELIWKYLDEYEASGKIKEYSATAFQLVLGRYGYF